MPLQDQLRYSTIERMRTPDIELTESERELFSQIHFHSSRYEELRASTGPMVALSESLLRRRGFPEVRLRYFTDADRNPGGRGKSRKDVFEKNGTFGSEILAHPHFMKYLEYFVCGPNLPASAIAEFKEAARFSGYLTGKDVLDQIPMARALVRSAQMSPHDAADEFHKLVLECGGMPSSAESIRSALRSIKVKG